MIRFTTWLSDRERDGLRTAAERLGVTQNYVMRVALRSFLGLPIPRFEQTDETDTTSQGVATK